MDEKDQPIEQLNQTNDADDLQVAALISFFSQHKEVGEAFEKLGKFKIEGDSWIFPEDHGIRSGFKAYDEYGLFHRENGPAVKRDPATDSHGEGYSESYYIHGQRHREDGPAMIRVQGDPKTGQLEIEHWYQNGKLHRDPSEGPAVSSYLDTDTGEIDPHLLDTRDWQRVKFRYERRYDYYVNGESIATNTTGGPLEAEPQQTDEAYEYELDKMLELAGVRRATDANGDPTDPLHWPLPNAEYRGRIGGPTMADRVPPKSWPNMVTGEIK